MDKVIWIYIDLRDMRLGEAYDITNDLKLRMSSFVKQATIIDRDYLWYPRLHKMVIAVEDFSEDLNVKLGEILLFLKNWRVLDKVKRIDLYNLGDEYYDYRKEWVRPGHWETFKSYINYYLYKLGLRERDPEGEVLIGKNEN